MSAAANAVMDVIAPPSRPASPAGGDNQGKSFEKHVAAADQRETHPGLARERQAKTRGAESNQAEAEPAEAASNITQSHTEKTEPAAPESFFLQLIANKASAAGIAPTGAASTQAETRASETGKAGQPQTPVIAISVTPIKTAPKIEPGPRSMPKAGKDADVKTQPRDTESAAPQATASVEPEPQVAPITAPNSILSAVAKTAETIDVAKIGAVDAAADKPSRAAPSRPTPTSPLPAPAQPQQGIAESPGASDAKSGETSKAGSAPEHLKQAGQEFEPAAQRSAPPPPSTHPQLTQPVQQAPIDDRTAARAAAPTASAQVGSEIVRRFNGQDTSFQLRLDPPELGRVDVRLDVSRDHRVTAVISADTPQALSDLARGARDLQQALQSAGLDLADDGLRFDLSSNGQGSAFAHAQQDQPGHRGTTIAAREIQGTPDNTPPRPLSIDSWRGARVDLMA